MTLNKIYQGDALAVLKTFPDECVQCCITSPPYWGLRDYGIEGQLGLESTPEEYVAKLVEIFREVRRVLRKDGTVWLNLGDSYANTTSGYGERGGNLEPTMGAHQNIEPKKKKIPSGLKPKDLVGIPWHVAFALQADGWYLRSDIIWSKPNPMPESVTDRPTKAHEYMFLLTKLGRYYYDQEAIKEPVQLTTISRYQYLNDGGSQKCSYGDSDKVSRINPIIEKPGHKDELIKKGRNRRSVWTIAKHTYPEAHFATFPEALVEPCIMAGSAEGDAVLDPFIGSGTVAKVALRAKRKFIGIELNPEYIKLAEKRIEPLMRQEVLEL